MNVTPILKYSTFFFRRGQLLKVFIESFNKYVLIVPDTIPTSQNILVSKQKNKHPGPHVVYNILGRHKINKQQVNHIKRQNTKTATERKKRAE